MIPISAPLSFKRRRMLLGAGSAVLAAGAPRRGRAAPNDVLRYALSTYPPSFRPWQNVGAAAGAVKLQCFRSLVSYDSQGNLRGEIAESWTSPDPRSYVFVLREGAKFHDGTPIDPDAVRFYFESVAAPKSTAYLRSAFEAVEKVEAIDKRTVRVVLKEPSATFLQELPTYNAGMISPRSTEAEPVGSGPYRIADQERGTFVEVRAVDGFYRPGRPRTRRIRFTAYADENLRVAALQAGDVDMIEYVPWQSMASIETNPKLRMVTAEGAYMCLQFNVAQGPFRDKRLRQAVACAIRREDIVNSAFSGRGSVLNGVPIPRSSPFWNAELADGWKLDTAKAKRLLAQAGHPDGFACSLLSTPTYGMHKDTAEVVQQSLAAIGVQVELKLPEWGTRVQLGGRGQYDFAVGGYSGDFNDPDALTASVAGGQPPSYARSWGFDSPDVNRLLAEGRKELDAAKRRAIYDQLQRVLLDEAAYVGLAWRSQGYAFRQELTGFTNLPGFLTFISTTSLEDVTVA